MIVKQLTVFLENKPGVLAAVSKALAKQGVNIRALSVSDTVDHAVVRIVVDDTRTAIHVLGEHGALVVETDVLAVQLPDEAGSLADLSTKLARAKVNIEYAYGSTGGESPTLFLRVSDTKKAASMLKPAKASGKKAARKS